MGGHSKNIQSALDSHPLYPGFLRILQSIEQSGGEVFLVGGAVRDALLGRSIKDFDLATSCTPKQLKDIFKDNKLILVGEAFGTIGVTTPGGAFEITTYRADGTYLNRRHPDHVQYGISLKEDSKRRDFTVNAMAYHPKAGLVDHWGGVQDLEQSCLRAVGEPFKRFEEDALRVLRLFRFYINCPMMSFDPKTFKAAIKALPTLKELSKERVFQEVKKTLESPQVDLLKLQALVFKIFKKPLNLKISGCRALSFLEQVYVFFELSELNSEFKCYALSKEYKEAISVLKKLKSCDRTSKKENLEFKNLLTSWSYKLSLGDYKNLAQVFLISSWVNPYEKEDGHIQNQLMKLDFEKLKSDQAQLKQKHKGPELGKKLKKLVLDLVCINSV